MYEVGREAQLKPGQTKTDLALWQVMLAGAAGGIGYWVSIYPVDIIKTTMQSDNPDPKLRRYKGFADATRQIYADFGIKGFFRGFTPAIVRCIPANAGESISALFLSQGYFALFFFSFSLLRTATFASFALVMNALESAGKKQ